VGPFFVFVRQSTRFRLRGERFCLAMLLQHPASEATLMQGHPLVARSAAVLPALVALVLYLPRVCPTLALVGDSAELVTTGVTHGVAHAPGFPLYTLVVSLFVKLPLLEIPWRANVSSALFHGATIGVVAALIGRITGSALAAIAGSLTLALAKAFVLSSLYAEVFPLNDLFFATVLLLACGSHRAARDLDDPTRRRAHGALWRLALVAGLASADQQTIVLSAPALAVLVAQPLFAAVRARPARLLLYLVLFLGPFAACYGDLWLAAARHPPVSWGDVHDVTSLWRLFTRADYWDHFHRDPMSAWEGLDRRALLFARLAFASTGAIVCAFAALGLAAHWSQSRLETISLALAFAVAGPLFAVATPLFVVAVSPELMALAERFVSMSLIPLAVLVGCGVAAAERWLRRRVRRMPFLPAVVAGILVLPLAPSAMAEDMSADRRGIALAHDLVNQTPDDSLVLLTGDLNVQAADYACFVENACGHRIVLTPGLFFLPWRLTQLRRSLPDIAAELPPVPRMTNIHELVSTEIQKRPVYLMPDFMQKDPGLGAYAFAPDLLLVRLYASAAAAADDRARVTSRARAMGEDRDCEGCSLYFPSTDYHPQEEVLLKLAYATAYANQARAARLVLGETALSEILRSKAGSIASAPPP